MPTGACDFLVAWFHRLVHGTTESYPHPFWHHVPMATKSSRDLTQGPIGRTLFVFALPILAGNVLQSLNGSVNAIWVGHFLGEQALTATANANNIMFFLIGAIFGVGMAATILVGQAIGAKDMAQAKRVIGTSATFFFCVSVAIALVGLPLSRHILVWMSTPPRCAAARGSLPAHHLHGGAVPVHVRVPVGDPARLRRHAHAVRVPADVGRAGHRVQSRC